MLAINFCRPDAVSQVLSSNMPILASRSFSAAKKEFLCIARPHNDRELFSSESIFSPPSCAALVLDCVFAALFAEMEIR